MDSMNGKGSFIEDCMLDFESECEASGGEIEILPDADGVEFSSTIYVDYGCYSSFELTGEGPGAPFGSP